METKANSQLNENYLSNYIIC